MRKTENGYSQIIDCQLHVTNLRLLPSHILSPLNTVHILHIHSLLLTLPSPIPVLHSLKNRPIPDKLRHRLPKTQPLNAIPDKQLISPLIRHPYRYKNPLNLMFIYALIDIFVLFGFFS